MNKIRFDWDRNKNKVNERKHGISFKEAHTVFYDERAIEFHDPDHSRDEDRFLMLGTSSRLRVLLVSYCFRTGGSEIRIISARKATKKEAEYYEGR
jgi:uncharacterized DUF497 family protein